jgi:hypothetical protein
MADQDQKSTVRVDFKKSPTYSIIPATGIWVTKTADGNILCNFVVESEDTPDHLVLGVNSSGQAISEEERNFARGQEHGYIKEFSVGIVMSPNTAIEIGNGLINTTNMYLSALGALADDRIATNGGKPEK